ncbi:MAG: hypothetical protein FWC79_05555 [Oscillospiraceae bacterium]|nr:hypothetical protein [Oscillospiraceae bacterium]
MDENNNKLSNKTEIYNKVSVLSIFTILNIQTFIIYMYVIYIADILPDIARMGRQLIVFYLILIICGIVSYSKNRLKTKTSWTTVSEEGIEMHNIHKGIRKWEEISKITFHNRGMFLASKDGKEVLVLSFDAKTAVNKIELVKAINKFKPNELEVVDNEDIYINYTSRFLLRNYMIQAMIMFVLELVLIYAIGIFIGVRIYNLGNL